MILPEQLTKLLVWDQIQQMAIMQECFYIGLILPQLSDNVLNYRVPQALEMVTVFQSMLKVLNSRTLSSLLSTPNILGYAVIAIKKGSYTYQYNGVVGGQQLIQSGDSTTALTNTYFSTQKTSGTMKITALQAGKCIVMNKTNTNIEVIDCSENQTVASFAVPSSNGSTNLMAAIWVAS